MALQQDENGFLTGTPVEALKRLSQNMRKIKEDVAQIKQLLRMSGNEQIKNNRTKSNNTTSERTAGNQQRVNEVRLRDSRGRFTSQSDSQQQEQQRQENQVNRNRRESEQRLTEEINEISRNRNSRKSTNQNSDSTNHNGQSEQQRQRTERKRDANGRFTSENSNANRENTVRRRNAKGQFEGNGSAEEKNFLSRSFDSLGNKISEAIQLGTGGLEEVDPTVKAFQEVAEPLSRGYQFLTGNKEEKRDKKYFGWLGKIWKSVKKTEDNTEESSRDNGNGESFLGSLLGAKAIVAVLTTVLGLIFSPIGLAIGAAGVAAWGLFTKSGNRFFDGLTDWVSRNVFEPVGNAFNTIETAVTKKWNDTIATVSTMFEGMGKKWDELIAGGKALLDRFLVNPVKAAKNNVESNHAKAVNWTSEKIEQGVDLYNSAKDKLVSVTAKHEKVVNATTDAVENGVNTFKNEHEKVVNSATNTIENGVNTAGDAKNWMIDKADSVSKTASKQWNDLKRRARWESAKPLISNAANQAEIDPGILAKISNFESGFNSEARPIRNGKRLSSAHGYGQFLDSTWESMIKKHGAKYGLDVNNPNKYRSDKDVQAKMLAEFTKENIITGRKYGGTDDAANVYALHNLGGGNKGGGAKFLKALKNNPNAPVSSVLSREVIKGNPSLYGNGSISLSEAYANMGKAMDAGNAYANDIRANLPKQTVNQKPAQTNTAKAISPIFKPVAQAQTVIPAMPAIPSVFPKTTAIAEAPALTMPIASDTRKTEKTLVIAPEIGQDLPDPFLAHIVAPYMRNAKI